MVLEKINQPNDIKSLTDDELKILASEIREFLIEKISVTGGHLASNLGVVELTMALHQAQALPPAPPPPPPAPPPPPGNKANMTALTPVTAPHRFPQDLGMRWRERSQGRTTKWSL